MNIHIIYQSPTLAVAGAHSGRGAFLRGHMRNRRNWQENYRFSFDGGFRVNGLGLGFRLIKIKEWPQPVGILFVSVLQYIHSIAYHTKAYFYLVRPLSHIETSGPTYLLSSYHALSLSYHFRSNPSAHFHIRSYVPYQITPCHISSVIYKRPCIIYPFRLIS